MPSYDATQYSPPAPVAEVALLSTQVTTRVDGVKLLIDSGADVTLLPRAAFERLGLPPQPDEKVELAGFDGSRTFAQAVTLDLLFLNRIYRSRYLLCDDAHGVLGRDVLNHVKLVLDGPQRLWSQCTS
jgi:hypothetical protein